MEVLHPDPGKIFPQDLCIIQDIFCLDHLAFLHHGTDHIGLTALFHLSGDELIRPAPVAGIHHTVFNGKPVGRNLVDDRNVQIPVQDDGQGPGNGRGAHDHHMGEAALASKKLPLGHAEPVLFVSDHQGQPVIDHLFLDQGMGSDDDVRLVGGDLFIGQPLFLCRHGAGHQHGAEGNVIFPEHGLHSLIMLLCQHLCGSHKSPLEAVFCGRDQRQDGDDGLSGAHVSLDQPVHDLSAFKIRVNLRKSPLLGLCERIRKGSLQAAAFCVLFKYKAAL